MKLFKSKSVMYIIVLLFSFIFSSVVNNAVATTGGNHTNHPEYGCCLTGSPGGSHPQPGNGGTCTPACCDTPTNDCENIFADAIQSHSGSTGDHNGARYGIIFQCDAQVINNPDIILESGREIMESGGNHCSNAVNTCSTADCVASGTPAQKLSACKFLTYSGSLKRTIDKDAIESVSDSDYKQLTVKQDATANFVDKGSNTEYKIGKLDIQQGAVVNLVPGDYWIYNLEVAQGAKINVVGEGTARIFVGTNLQFGHGSQINQASTVSNQAKQLFIYAFKNVQFHESTVFYGFVYSKMKISLEKYVAVVGALLGEEIILKKGSTVTFDPDARDELDLAFLCPPVTHFELSHLPEGIKCFKHNVTLTIKKGSKTVTNYDKTVVLDTGTGLGTWFLVNGNGTFVDATEDDGFAEYTFAETDNGVAEFQLLYAGGEGPAVVDVEVYQKNNPDIRDDDKSGTITFYVWGYVITAQPFNTGADPSAQAYTDVQTAGVPDDMYISAYGQGADQSVSSCNVRTNYTGSVTLKMWQNYINPTSGTMTMTIDGTPIGNAEVNAVDIPVQFDAGVVKVTSLYKDVGMLRVYAKSEESLHPGSTGNFVVKPARLVLSIYDNPAASGSDGPVFRKAGDGFGASVEVQEMGGALTPNFGNEIEPEKVQIFSSQLVAPSGGRNGSNNDGLIGNGANLSRVSGLPGKFESLVLTFDEVGIIKLRAQIFDQDYLGAGNILSLESENVGRFTPYVFDATGNTPMFSTACPVGRFSYIGQPFIWSETPKVEVIAKAKAGTITMNYFGSYWKLIPSAITQSYTSNSVSPITSTVGSPTVVSHEADPAKRGTGLISYESGDGVQFNKVNSTNIAPFEAEVQLSSNIFDSDNVPYRNNPFTFGETTSGSGILFTDGNTFYQGRFNIKDNITLESKTARLACMTEYFNGTDYVINKADNCTVFTEPSHLILDKQPASLDTTPSIDPVVNGKCTIKLTPPSGGKTGEQIYVIVRPQLQFGFFGIPWLQHDWKYDDLLDGIYDDNPAAKSIWGYRGGDESIIYTEEPLSY